MSLKISLTAAVALVALQASADIVQAGSGSYTTVFPGNDAAGRNSFPNATPLVTGNAALRPVPTNDWWSPKLTTAVPNNMFNYPLGVRTLMEGFDMQKTIFNQAQSVENSILISTAGISSAESKVSDYTDWTVTFNRTQGDKWMEATFGIGMPMAYFTKSDNAGDVTVAFNGQASVDGNILIVTGSYNGASFAVYAPSGSTWTVDGKTATSNLGGRNYWSAAMLPDNANASSQAKAWASSAFAFPADTRAEWSYDTAKGGVTTRYVVTVDNKEGTGTALMGLLPHQWANLDAATSLPSDAPEYKTVRGKLKMLQANEFTTWLPFHGILPTLPAMSEDTGGYSADELKKLINEVIDDHGFDPWTDSYNDGQLLNRMVQTARIADEAGLVEESAKMRTLIREKLEDWLSYETGEVAFLFYYHEPYGALLGYPSGHGQDSNINDHHFHWGYIIGAAAYIGQNDPEWASSWGPMVDLLVRDAASADRNDPLFPYQRSFSPYAGHCWANGFGTSGPGNDQESTSEAMQFHSNLLHWAEVTGNKALRDQAVYMYVTEVSATNEYWFDREHRNFESSYNHFLASRVFTNGYDYENFWGGGAAGSLGIEIYPVHAGSFYLVDDAKWADSYWNAMCSETGILNKDTNPNIWYDTWWKFLAMIRPEKALELYDAYPGRTMKFGVSQAHTYQWLHALASLGRANRRLTADCPTAMAFDKGDVRTYAVHNYSDADITVKFSDGFTMTAPAGKLTTATGVNPDPVEELPDTPGGPTDPTDPDTPDNPDNPGTGSCTYTDTEASDGSFSGPYTVKFTTKGNAVEITARFEGSYVGIDPCYLFDETDGFREIMMSKSGDMTWTYTLNNIAAGTTLRVRVKLPYAGGLGVTKYLTYTIGEDCDQSGIAAAAASSIDFRYDGSTVEISADGAGVAQAYSVDGRAVASRMFTDTVAIDTQSWASGVYIILVDTPCGSRTFRIIK